MLGIIQKIFSSLLILEIHSLLLNREKWKCFNDVHFNEKEKDFFFIAQCLRIKKSFVCSKKILLKNKYLAKQHSQGTILHIFSSVPLKIIYFLYKIYFPSPLLSTSVINIDRFASRYFVWVCAKNFILLCRIFW